MNHENVALHNVVEIDSAPGGGLLLRRWPQAMRCGFSPLGRMVSQESAGVEIRFVTEARHFRLSLGALPSQLAPHEKHHCDVMVFRGAFLHSHHHITPGQINHINIGELGEVDRFLEIDPAHGQACGFSPRVWRVFLGRYPAVWYGLDCYDYPVRPPHPGEVPSHQWVAYGSSITSGGGAKLHYGGYVYHAARELDLDVCNLGLSGSCLCEPAVADYLAQRPCDLLTLEIGVNMRTAFKPHEFRERAKYLVDQVCATQKARKVVLISIYPNSASAQIAAAPDGENTRHQSAYDDILRELAGDGRHENLSLVEGRDVLDDFNGLTHDLIHPSDYGHARMGHNLAARLRNIL